MSEATLIEQNVEQRLEMALFYRSVLESLRPEGQLNPVESAVMGELQGFVSGRMKVLMGIEPEQPRGQTLTPEEVGILKAVVEKLKNPEPQEEGPEVEVKQRPAAAPKPLPQRPAPKKPKAPVDPNALPLGLKATGQTLEMPFEVRGPTGLPVTRIKTFKEVEAPDGSIGWYGSDGQLYVIKEDATTGATFMQNVTRQTQSKTHRKQPQTYGSASVMLAAEQADRLTRGKSQSKIILDAAQRFSDAEAMGIINSG